MSVYTVMNVKKPPSAIDLPPVARKFVVHWGELGTRWGINRTVAQIHALLYMSQKPLDVQSICEILNIARSNASSSLRELQGWGVVRPIHVLGDRREHYEAISDVWQMVSILAEARKRREIDPTLAILRELAAELDAADKLQDRFVRTRVHAMLELFETVNPLIDEFARLPSAVVRTIAGLRGRLRSVLKDRK